MPDGVNIPGGPGFSGSPQPPDVPCDPTGEAWRGPPGPPGPPGPMPPGGPFLPLSGGVVTGNTTVRYDSTGNNAVIFTPNSTETVGTVAGAQLTSQLIAHGSGGTAGQIYANAQFGSSITGATNTYVWSVLSIADFSGTGGAGQHVAYYGQAIRRTQNAGTDPEMFGAVFEIQDYTNTDSALTGSMNGIEIDMSCGNTDSANNRRAIGIYLQRPHPGDVPPTCNLGIHIASTSGAYNTPLKIETPFNVAAIDLRPATVTGVGAHTVWFSDGGHIAWNTAGTATTVWNGSLFAGAGGVEHSGNVQADGAIRAVGNLTAGGAAIITGNLGVGGTSNLGGLATFQGGIACQPVVATGPGDFSKHISLYATNYGISVTGGFINYVSDTGQAHAFYAGATLLGRITPTGLNACAVGQTTTAAGAFTTLAASSTLSVTGVTGLNGGAGVTGGLSINGGANWGNQVAGSGIDLSKHIALYGSVYGFSVTGGFLNHVADNGGAHVFYAGSTQLGAIGQNGVQTGGSGGPTWTTGSAPPASTQPIGSLYSRTGGAVGSTLYVSRGGGTWNAVAGV